jgi:hypothetical protein
VPVAGKATVEFRSDGRAVHPGSIRNLPYNLPGIGIEYFELRRVGHVEPAGIAVDRNVIPAAFPSNGIPANYPVAGRRHRSIGTRFAGWRYSYLLRLCGGTKGKNEQDNETNPESNGLREHRLGHLSLRHGLNCFPEQNEIYITQCCRTNLIIFIGWFDRSETD